MTTITLASPLSAPRHRADSRSACAPAGLGGTTRIRTLMGWKPVQSLLAGDLVLDQQGNLHELRGIRQAKVDGAQIVRVARKGRSPLCVGAGQALLADDWRTQVLFGQPVTSRAGRMVDGGLIRRGRPGRAKLFQLHFDRAVSLDLDGAIAVICSSA